MRIVRYQLGANGDGRGKITAAFFVFSKGLRPLWNPRPPPEGRKPYMILDAWEIQFVPLRCGGEKI